MCLIAFAWRAHPRFELAVIANRDEFHARPAAAASEWADAPGVYGGRDLQCGGGWLLYSRQRRFAAVTNVRLPQPASGRPRSRGELVADFAAGDAPAQDFSRRLSDRAGEYAPFNLLLWDGGALHYARNHPAFRHGPVAPGVHTLSNAALDVPWPKSAHAGRGLADWLASPAAGAEPPAIEPLFAVLAQDRPAPDAELPDTGVGLERERMLSAAFIRGGDYGTRASMVLLVDADGAWFAERRFGPGGEALERSCERL